MAGRTIRQVVDGDAGEVIHAAVPTAKGAPKARPAGSGGHPAPSGGPVRVVLSDASATSRSASGPGLLSSNGGDVNARERFDSERYQLLRAVGKGGMGTVYEARDTLLDMAVAIKFLPERLLADADAVRSFKQEARIVMRLSHEGIVRMHNLDYRGGRMFVVMEYVDGQNMRHLLEQSGRLDLGTSLQLAQCCSIAVGYAHRRDVLHRDLKPENLMLTSDGIPKIVDFGTAGWASRMSRGHGLEYLEGTPGYMSPELIRREPLDQRSDIYALGVMVHEFMEGVSPFAPNADPRAPREASVLASEHIPPPVVKVLQKAYAARAADRWESTHAFYAALSQACEPFLDAE